MRNNSGESLSQSEGSPVFEQARPSEPDLDALGLYAAAVHKQKLLEGYPAEVALAQTMESGAVAEAVLLGRQQAREEQQGIVYQTTEERIAEVRRTHQARALTKAVEAAERDAAYTPYLMERFPEDQVPDEILQVLQAKGHAARDTFICSNTPLAMSLAARYKCRAPLIEKIQWANIGLIRAVDKFDWQRGIKFSTHAAWWINQSLNRENETRGRILRLPGNIIREVSKVMQAQRTFANEQDTEPSDEQLAEATGYSVKVVQRSKHLRRDVLSFEGLTAHFDAETDPYVLLPFDSTPSAELQYEQQTRAIQFKEALAAYLKPEDITLLYAVYCDPDLLAEEVRKRAMSKAALVGRADHLRMELAQKPELHSKLVAIL